MGRSIECTHNDHLPYHVYDKETSDRCCNGEGVGIPTPMGNEGHRRRWVITIDLQ